jgi:hypothetical protein
MSIRLSLLIATMAAVAAVALPSTAVGASGGVAYTPSATAAVVTTCPATFQVLHNDRVGALRLAAGAYTVTTSGDLSCAQASKLFTRFLEDWDGVLPGGWQATADGFSNADGSTGFTVALAATPIPGGGGTTGRPCSGTFDVMHNDHIDSLKVAGGPYVVYALGGLTCAQAMSDLRVDLAHDTIPARGWTLDTQTATFMWHHREGFRVEPANGV